VTKRTIIFVTPSKLLQVWSVVAAATLCLGVATATADDRSVCGSVAPKSAAVTACSRVIASPRTSDHDRALAYTFRAGAKRLASDMTGAIADYGEALTLLPDFPQALIGRGIAYRGSGDFAHATADLDQALKLDPKNAKALYERGLAKRQSGDLTGADADIAAAAAFDPGIANRR
jgi:tetratricopeptide (TPR) repeat protein